MGDFDVRLGGCTGDGSFGDFDGRFGGCTGDGSFGDFDVRLVGCTGDGRFGDGCTVGCTGDGRLGDGCVCCVNTGTISSLPKLQNISISSLLEKVGIFRIGILISIVLSPSIYLKISMIILYNFVLIQSAKSDDMPSLIRWS